MAEGDFCLVVLTILFYYFWTMGPVFFYLGARVGMWEVSFIFSQSWATLAVHFFSS